MAMERDASPQRRDWQPRLELPAEHGDQHVASSAEADRSSMEAQSPALRLQFSPVEDVDKCRLAPPGATSPRRGSHGRGSQPAHLRGADVAEPTTLPSRNSSRSRRPRSRRTSSPRRSMQDDNFHEPGRRSSVLSTVSSTAGPTAGLRLRRATNSSTVLSIRPDFGLPDHGDTFPGAEPGIDTTIEADDLLPEHLSTLKARCDIHIIDYSEDHRMIRSATNENLASILEIPRSEELPCRWISVNGISWDVIRVLGNKYQLHQLAIEDLIHARSRTKVDWYSKHCAVVLTLQKLVRLHEHRGVRHDDCPQCTASVDYDAMDEKSDPAAADSKSWFSLRGAKSKSVLPVHTEKNARADLEATVTAYSTTSQDSPVREVRTLHRYENALIPEHTAWMEKNSALTAEGLTVSVEQVCLFLLDDNTVISFFEHSAPDIERPLFARLESRYTVLRKSCDASMLLQAIIDAVVDLASPVSDAFNKARKELQIAAMTNPDIRTSRALHIFGEEINMMHNLFKPIVHLVNAIRDHNSDAFSGGRPFDEYDTDQGDIQQYGIPTCRPNKHDRESSVRKMFFQHKRTSHRQQRITGPSVTITPLAHTYFGDVLDHCITTIAALEQMEASAKNISDLIFSTISAKINQFIMILAVVTVFFSPLTFITGYFGMNFASGGGLDHPFDFFFVVAAPSVTGFMLLVYIIYKRESILDWFGQGPWKPTMSLPTPVRRPAMIR